MRLTNVLCGLLAGAGTGLAVALPAQAQTAPLRNIMYYDQWHHDNVNIPSDLAAKITHVVMGFAPTTIFNGAAPGYFAPFTTVASVRALFPATTKVGIAIGGWGDSAGLSAACLTAESRSQYAANIAMFLTQQGFDFVDVDWEYPGGNGEDYRRVSNDQKVAEIAAFPQLLAAVKTAIAPKQLSIAVPGKAGDMIAWTLQTAPAIFAAVDWVNVMSYDLLNRRDTVTGHHTGVVDSLASIDRYLVLGADPAKLNLGFAFYAKYFETIAGVDCTNVPVGCPLKPAELADGSDAGTSGAVTFEPASFADTWSPKGQSLALAMQQGKTDEAAGGQYWWDPQRALFWTFETPALVARKFDQIVAARGLGGVFAWSLGEDSYDWALVRAIHDGIVRHDGY